MFGFVPAKKPRVGWVALLAAGLLFLHGTPARAVLLLNDTFADAERLTQSGVNSARWYTGGLGSTASVSSSSGLTLDASSGKATAMAYFNPTTLGVGETISLSFNYSFGAIANGDNNFMFGLYDSGGSYLTQDNLGFNNSLFSHYTGVATSGVFGPDPSGPGRDHIELRDKVANNLLSISSYSEGLESRQVGAATPGEVYSASMAITRTSTGLMVESKIGTTTMVQKFEGTSLTRFDAVGVFATGNTGSFTVDGVKVEYTGLPEPSSLLAMGFFGSVLLGGVVRRRLQEFTNRRADTKSLFQGNA